METWGLPAVELLSNFWGKFSLSERLTKTEEAQECSEQSDWQVQLQFLVCFTSPIERNYRDKVLQEFRIEVGEAARG